MLAQSSKGKESICAACWQKAARGKCQPVSMLAQRGKGKKSTCEHVGTKKQGQRVILCSMLAQSGKGKESTWAAAERLTWGERKRRTQKLNLWRQQGKKTDKVENRFEMFLLSFHENKKEMRGGVIFVFISRLSASFFTTLFPLHNFFVVYSLSRLYALIQLVRWSFHHRFHLIDSNYLGWWGRPDSFSLTVATIFIGRVLATYFG